MSLPRATRLRWRASCCPSACIQNICPSLYPDSPLQLIDFFTVCSRFHVHLVQMLCYQKESSFAQHQKYRRTNSSMTDFFLCLVWFCGVDLKDFKVCDLYINITYIIQFVWFVPSTWDKIYHFSFLVSVQNE